MEGKLKRKFHGCPTCQYYQAGRIRVWQPDIPKSCGQGHSETFKKWWKDNGHKTQGMELTPTPVCYQMEEGMKKLMDLKGQLGNLSQLIKETDEKIKPSKNG